MTGYVHPPAFDPPRVLVTAERLVSAMAYIETARPKRFLNLLRQAGLLAAGVAKLIDDGIAGGRGGYVDFGEVASAMVRVASSRPKIGRTGLEAGLSALADLVLMHRNEADKPRAEAEMDALAVASLAAFDLLNGDQP